MGGNRRDAKTVVGGATDTTLAADQTGKRTLHQGPTGAAWPDNGTACEADPKRKGCMLSSSARQALIALLLRRMTVAESHYGLALERLRVANLLKKADELPWFVNVVLDVAAGFIIGKVTAGLISLKDGDKSTVKSILGEVDPDLDMGNFDMDIGLDFTGIGDAGIKSNVKRIVDARKAAFGKSLAKDSEKAYDKSATQSYVDLLGIEVARTYDSLASTLPATATDAELIAFYHSMDPGEHTVPQYEAALGEKIRRFLASAGDIGRRNQQSPTGSHHRDTRVVWVHYLSGHPPVLRTQTFDYSNPMMTQMPDNDRTRAFASGRSEGEEGMDVPAEFASIAVMRHKEQWGEDPKTITIDEDTQGDFWQREPLRAYKARQAKERDQKLMSNPQMAPGQTYGPDTTPPSVVSQPDNPFGAKPKTPPLAGPLGFSGFGDS